MVAFHAAQSLVDRTIGIAFDGHGALTGNTDQKAASCTAKPAGRLFPCNSSRIDIFPGPETDPRKQYRSRSDGALHGCGFYELSSGNVHLLTPSLCLFGLKLSQNSGSGSRAPLKRDYMSNLNRLRYASRRRAAQKSCVRAYTIVCEHFVLI